MFLEHIWASHDFRQFKFSFIFLLSLVFIILSWLFFNLPSLCLFCCEIFLFCRVFSLFCCELSLFCRCLLYPSVSFYYFAVVFFILPRDILNLLWVFLILLPLYLFCGCFPCSVVSVLYFAVILILFLFYFSCRGIYGPP